MIKAMNECTLCGVLKENPEDFAEACKRSKQETRFVVGNSVHFWHSIGSMRYMLFGKIKIVAFSRNDHDPSYKICIDQDDNKLVRLEHLQIDLWATEVDVVTEPKKNTA